MIISITRKKIEKNKIFDKYQKQFNFKFRPATEKKKKLNINRHINNTECIWKHTHFSS